MSQIRTPHRREEHSRSILPSALHEVHRRVEQRGADVLPLHIGDPHIGISQSVREAFVRAIRDGHSYYCDAPGLPAFRAALSQRIAETTGARVDVDRIFTTPGSCQGIGAIMLSIAVAGGAILLPEIHWPMHLQQVCMAGLRARFYQSLTQNRTTAEILDEVYEPDVCAILVNSPSNPSGEVLPAQVLREIHEWAQRRDVWIINDEAYQDFVFEGDTTSLTFVDSTAKECDRRVFSVHTFSKGFSMTGYRLGYVTAPNEERARLLLRVQEALLVCPSTPVQFAGLSALADREHLQLHHTYVRDTRDAVVEYLESTRLLWKVPQGGWYALLDLSRYSEGADACCKDLLEEDNVALAPGYAFAPAGHPQAARVARMALCQERSATLRALTRIVARLERSVPAQERGETA